MTEVVPDWYLVHQ